jgi:carbonic anhydrase
VRSAIDVATKGISLPGDIDAVVAPIVPVVTATRDGGDESLDAAIAANVEAVVAKLSGVPILRERLAAGSRKVVGGEYQLDSGAVELVAP